MIHPVLILLFFFFLLLWATGKIDSFLSLFSSFVGGKKEGERNKIVS
jgi:hypothetical protein